MPVTPPPAPAAPAPRPSATMPMPTGNGKLLIFDADVQTIRQVGDAVAGHFELIVCRDPRRIPSLLDQHADLAAIVAEDVKIPDTAATVLAVARDRRPGVLRVALSPLTDLSAVVAGLRAGTVQRVAKKPIDARELLAQVTRR